jgi:hypothetical protein
MNESVQLLTRDACSDDDGGRDAIARSYQILFKVFDERRLEFDDLLWRDIGDAVQAVRHFGVNVMENDQDWVAANNVNITFHIQKRGRKCTLHEVVHSYVC